MSVLRTCKVRSQTISLELESDEQPEGTRNHELWRADTFDSKEPDTLDWIDTCIRPGDVLYDVGANIGQYSLYAAKQCKGDLTVLAFEPEALNFAKLNRNIVLNDMVEIIVPYPIAISNQTAVDTFYSKTFAVGASLHALGREITQGEKEFTPQNRQGTISSSLDDLTTRFGLPVPNHIKVDVDGIEDLIVEGAVELFTNPELRTFLIEVYMHGDIAGRIRKGFEAGGFTLSNEADTDFTQGVVQNLIFTR